MKILFGMPSKDSWGGPAACEPPFVEALSKLGVDVVTEDYVFGDKDRPTPFLSRVSRVLKTAFKFRRLIRSDQFDILFLNSAFDKKSVLRDTISLFIIGSKQTKVFLKVHGSLAHEFVGRGGLFGFVVSYFRQRLDGIGLHNREELTAFIDLGFNATKFYRVRNAITIGSELPSDFVREQKTASRFELLFVSRFVATKGLLETIEAAAILREKGIDFRLTCVGDGEIREAAENLTKQLSLSSFVRFTGYIPEAEVSKLFVSSDIFVFPTQHPEGFPIVLFKAVATGMPIVTTPIRAACEYLSDPTNCIFCTMEPESIAEKVIELIESHLLRTEMSASNLAYGKTLMPDHIAADYLSMFESLVENKPSVHNFEIT